MEGKILYFGEPVPEILCIGEKYSTFRAGDNDINVGDYISFKIPYFVEFAGAYCSEVRKTVFGKLTDKDWEGHERFSSEKEMLKIYSNWEQREITMESKVKIIRWSEYDWFNNEPLKKYLK